MEATLVTSRLILRLLSPAHASQVLDFYEKNREYFDLWEPTRPNNFYTENFHLATLAWERQQILKFVFLRYWIFEKNAPDEIIGSISFHNIRKHIFQCCMLGYKIDRSHCCRGYATEACLTAIRSVFSEYRLHRMEALVQPSNAASIKVLERLSFIREGLSRSCAQVNGQWEDHYRYALINPADTETSSSV